ncbi:MAG TPA: segregation/condensation protein A [Thiotrichaceae bacterium]|jgi:segregation and condensation protein A|nr:segregation/condensation protein A [Thiotrichaceae bacterium]HIM07805.1 segregation/condensation protein A [Gammaproteobacteria bacterium]
MSEDIKTTEVVQDEMPFALVQGTPVTELPKDLYIPPDALEVFLEAFEGPLDLLLYLIKKQNLDILDIPLAKITEQYMSYIEMMDVLQLELAGEYLLMAAMLAEIKSRMLLPRQTEEESGEEDPRAELIRRLQEYERYKQAAENLNELPRIERDLFATVTEFPGRKINQEPPQVSMEAILLVFADVVKRADMFSHHMIKREALSVRERMGIVLEKVNAENFTDFEELFSVEEGRGGVIVSLLAILQLVKDSLIQLVQNDANGKIYVKAAT